MCSLFLQILIAILDILGEIPMAGLVPEKEPLIPFYLESHIFIASNSLISWYPYQLHLVAATQIHDGLEAAPYQLRSKSAGVKCPQGSLTVR
jgi:hypothetical protein